MSGGQRVHMPTLTFGFCMTPVFSSEKWEPFYVTHVIF